MKPAKFKTIPEAVTAVRVQAPPEGHWAWLVCFEGDRDHEWLSDADFVARFRPTGAKGSPARKAYEAALPPAQPEGT